MADTGPPLSKSATVLRPTAKLAKKNFGFFSPGTVALSNDLAGTEIQPYTFPRMDDTSQKVSRTIWIGIALVILLLAATFLLSNVKTRRRATSALPDIGQIADFSLTNQTGQAVTLADLRGKVWVADIIFSRCAGPCPRMTRQMESLQAALPKDSPARLVTLTTDPEFDTPAVLEKYAARFNADPRRWWFLTGAKKDIAHLAIDSLKLTAVEKKPAERENDDDLFIHSTIFVVVDKRAQLRGVFETDGAGVAWTNMQSTILETVRTLERER
jgi:protein SCO1